MHFAQPVNTCSLLFRSHLEGTSGVFTIILADLERNGTTTGRQAGPRRAVLIL